MAMGEELTYTLVKTLHVDVMKLCVLYKYHFLLKLCAGVIPTLEGFLDHRTSPLAGGVNTQAL